MTDQEILFASLVGGNIVKQLPRFSVIENEMQKHVLPSLSLFPVQNKEVHVTRDSVQKLDNLYTAETVIPEDRQFFPLSFSLTQNGTRWMLPYETMINIEGKNNIVRRTVAKWNDKNEVVHEGTVKERFSRDDYTISITGVLIGANLRGSVADCFPRSDFEKLRDFITAAKALYVWCEPLQILGISQMVIEDFSFPFTKGENVQAYSIKGYSDKSFNLVLT